MINPNNIFIGTEFSELVIKISHYGILYVFGEEKYIKNNLCYLAPETINEGIFKSESDIWSCGVLMYFIITEQLPFVAKSEDELKSNINKCEINFEHKAWKKIPKEAQDLLKRMLVVDTEKRITADDALSDAWLAKFNSRYKSFLD